MADTRDQNHNHDTVEHEHNCPTLYHALGKCSCAPLPADANVVEGAVRDARVTNVTDAEIEAAFAGTNFGSANHRRLLEMGVLKRFTGYHSGHTLTMIMRGLGLTTDKDAVTKKGRSFAFAAFYRSEHDG